MHVLFTPRVLSPIVDSLCETATVPCQSLKASATGILIKTPGSVTLSPTPHITEGWSSLTSNHSGAASQVDSFPKMSRKVYCLSQKSGYAKNIVILSQVDLVMASNLDARITSSSKAARVIKTPSSLSQLVRNVSCSDPEDWVKPSMGLGHAIVSV